MNVDRHDDLQAEGPRYMGVVADVLEGVMVVRIGGTGTLGLK